MDQAAPLLSMADPVIHSVDYSICLWISSLPDPLLFGGIYAWPFFPSIRRFPLLLFPDRLLEEGPLVRRKDG